MSDETNKPVHIEYHIDWALLKDQRWSLVRALRGDPVEDEIAEHLEGILMLLDTMADAAVEKYGWQVECHAVTTAGGNDE